MNVLLIITICVTLAVFLVMIGIYRWLRWSGEVQQRLAGVTTSTGGNISAGKAFTGQVNRSIGRLSFAERIEKQLVVANSNLNVAEYMMIRLGVAGIGLVLGALISSQLIGGILLAIVGWIIPGLWLSRQEAKRNKAFAEQLPDMLSLLVGSLRAGYGLLHACNVIRQEMPEPISSEFGRVVKETTLGYSLDDALDHMTARVQNEDFDLVVTAVHVQNEVGGSLADILETITGTIRERIKLNGEIRVMTSQQRLTGWILSALPLFVGTILTLVNPDYMSELFKPGWQLLIPITAAGMILIGNLAMRWLMKVEI